MPYSEQSSARKEAAGPQSGGFLVDAQRTNRRQISFGLRIAAPNAASNAPRRASRPTGPAPVFASCPAAPPPPPWVTVSALPVLPTTVDCVEPCPVPAAPVATVD